MKIFFSDPKIFDETFKSKLFAQGFHENFFSDNNSFGKRPAVTINSFDTDDDDEESEDHLDSDLNSNDKMPSLHR